MKNLAYRVKFNLEPFSTLLHLLSAWVTPIRRSLNNVHRIDLNLIKILDMAE